MLTKRRLTWKMSNCNAPVSLENLDFTEYPRRRMGGGRKRVVSVEALGGEVVVRSRINSK